MSYYKRSNGHLQRRDGNGQFRRTTLGDFGLGTCECGHFTQRVYDGDEKEAFLDPRKFRQRCFTCEPRTEAEETERQQRIEEQQKNSFSLEKFFTDIANQAE